MIKVVFEGVKIGDDSVGSKGNVGLKQCAPAACSGLLECGSWSEYGTAMGSFSDAFTNVHTS